MSEITITIKCSNSDKADITADNSITVGELKDLIAVKLSISSAQQRLIFRGRVLKDDLTLEHYEVTTGSTVHLVKGVVKTTDGASPAAATPAQPIAAPPAPSQTPQANPFGAFGGLGGLGGLGAFGGGMPDMRSMQDQLMRNPELMQQIMSSPMMESLMNNPDMMRNMMASNPQMQAMLDANPQVRHIMNDPAVRQLSLYLSGAFPFVSYLTPSFCFCFHVSICQYGM